MADSIITLFAFGTSGELATLKFFCDAIMWANQHDGQYPSLPAELSAPKSGRINGIARARSEPRAAPETFVAELTDTTPPLTVIGPVQNGYIPVRLWVYVPRLTVNE